MSRNLVKAFTILFRNFILSISLRIYKFLKIYRTSLYQEIVEKGGVCWVFQISRSVDNTDHGIAKRPLSTIPLPDQKTGFSVCPSHLCSHLHMVQSIPFFVSLFLLLFSLLSSTWSRLCLAQLSRGDPSFCWPQHLSEGPKPAESRDRVEEEEGERKRNTGLISTVRSSTVLRVVLNDNDATRSRFQDLEAIFHLVHHAIPIP